MPEGTCVTWYNVWMPVKPPVAITEAPPVARVPPVAWVVVPPVLDRPPAFEVPPICAVVLAPPVA